MGEAENLACAWQFAIQQNWAPSLFISVNWTHAPSSSRPDIVARIGKVRDCMKAFLTRAGVQPFVWVEVREKPRSKGEGVHWAVYVPDGLVPQFSAAVARWVAIEADDVGDAAVDVRPVGTRWWDRRDYMLKGGDDEVRQRYDCARFDKNGSKAGQGIIDGPRVRIAHSIGPTARRAPVVEPPIKRKGITRSRPQDGSASKARPQEGHSARHRGDKRLGGIP